MKYNNKIYNLKKYRKGQFLFDFVGTLLENTILYANDEASAGCYDDEQRKKLNNSIIGNIDNFTIIHCLAWCYEYFEKCKKAGLKYDLISGGDLYMALAGYDSLYNLDKETSTKIDNIIYSCGCFWRFLTYNGKSDQIELE